MIDDLPEVEAGGDRPDLVLGVQQQEDGRRLSFSLYFRGRERRFEQALDVPLTTYLEKLRNHVEGLPTGAAASGSETEPLAALGETLSRGLLPEALRSILDEAGVADPERQPPTLWIVSDEGRIPWEVVRVRGPEPAFLAESFTLAHWLWDLESTRRLGLSPLALLVSAYSGLQGARDERLRIEELAREAGVDLVPVPPTAADLHQVLARAEARAFHFVGHAQAEVGNPDLSYLILDDEGGAFRVADLQADGIDLRRHRPLVVLNACRTAHGEASLVGMGGLGPGFARAGAGAVLGTQWALPDGAGAEMSGAFYQALLDGETAAQAVRRARLGLRRQRPGDPTWLAYRLFAHPAARLDGPAGEVPAWREPVAGLEIPYHEWSEKSSPPGAMLRADHDVVPFHFRERELEELQDWCEDGEDLRVRLYTGPGGMGKTRLALEVCRRMRLRGWQTGFVDSRCDEEPQEAAERLVQRGGPLLAVLDYAETRRGLLVPILRALAEGRDRGPFRLVLLSRWREDWWDQLKGERPPVGSLIAGPLTTHHALAPLADRVEHREESFRRAARAFAERKAVPPPDDLPEDLDAPHFGPVLMLHMTALGRVHGVHLKGEDGILDWVLDREKRFWRDRMDDRGLAPELLPGVGQAMCAITLGGGTLGEGGTVHLMEHLRFFRGQPHSTLVGLARLLHETYPGDRWIMPVQPDVLGEHLIERELQDDPEKQEEIFDLVVGPRQEGA